MFSTGPRWLATAKYVAASIPARYRLPPRSVRSRAFARTSAASGPALARAFARSSSIFTSRASTAAFTARTTWPSAGAGEILLAHLLGFLATFLQLMATGAFVMTVSVATRTMTAAIVAPVLLLVISEISSIRYLMGGDPFGVVFPNVSGAAIRQFGQALMGEPDVLLRLARGSGLDGLSGMAARAPW